MKDFIESVSEIYVAKEDLGKDFYKIISLVNSCDFNDLNNWDSHISDEINNEYYLINLPNIFFTLQNNYFDLPGWKGPYLVFPMDDYWGWNFVFYKNKKKNEFRIFSFGPKFKADLSNLDDSDNIGFVIKE